MGKLDEISTSIGELRAGTKRLTELFDRHCDDDTRRHRENVDTLRDISKLVGDLKSTMTPIASTVATMEPIVTGYAISQWKKAGALGFALSLLSVVAWLLERAIGAAVEWAIGRLH